MSFLFPTVLAIGLPLVAVPLLIHLINLRRQQRIRWAAMQFLIESQRRNRRWILLKQLLLLAARMTAIALLVLMLAHLVLRNEWMRLLGNGTTHHVVLVDDSFSMSDRWDNTTALDEGKRAVQAIVDQARRQPGTHLVTLLRFSEAARQSAGGQPEVFSQPITDTLRSRLESLLAGWGTSQSDVGPVEALKAVARLPLAEDQQSAVLYLVSDFRARQFAASTEVRKLLDDLTESRRISQIHLVRCVREARPNLAITVLEPVSGARAADIEIWMRVAVANFGDQVARGVTVQLEQDGDALPALAFDDIPPREELEHKFRVQFAGAGAHSLTAALSADAVEVDNRRYFACELPAAQPVLIIDGSPDGTGGRQLTLALAPGGNTRTGWRPHVEPSSFLLDTEQLHRQAAVCLLDVPRLAEDELAALEEYVQSGGGVAFFVGPNADRAFYNERLYRDGHGLFPAPLLRPTQLLDRRGESAPDLEVTAHALFQVLAGRRNGLLPLVTVDFYYALADPWTPPADGSTAVIARLRNRAPLVIERKFGAGRVIAQLTKLSPANTPLGPWTNWSINRAFPVLANELVNYLAEGRHDDPLQIVGDDLVVSADENEYEPEFRLLMPAPGPTRPVALLDATPTAGLLTATLDDVALSGIYEVELHSKQRGTERRDFAFNVQAAEGDLALADRDQISRQLAGIDYHFQEASEMTVDQQHLAGFQMSDALLGVLIALLVGEQLLAYVSSYHIAPARAAAK